jgi:cytochrome c oxidase assembly protein subunit 15
MDYAASVGLKSGAQKTTPGLNRLAILTAAMTVFLIAAGATVTSTRSGDAIPDWPLAYGNVVPPLIGGVIIEYSHRIIAGVTALFITILAVWLWRSEQPQWLKGLGLMAFVGVLLQAALGGLRVLVVSNDKVQTTAVSVLNAPHVEPVRIGFAVTHATLAQIVLCLAFAIALFTSRVWDMRTKTSSLASCGRLLAWSAPLATALIFVQLLLGALMRHTEAGLIIPDFPSSFGRVVPPFNALPHDPHAPFPITYAEMQFKVAIHFAHRVNGLLIAVAIGAVAFQVRHHFQRVTPLSRLTSLLLCLVLAQITLGACAIWTGLFVPVTVAHVAVGASILGLSCLTTIASWRLNLEQRKS